MKDYIMDHGKVTFLINERMYPLESILKTAYIFIDNYYIFMDKKDTDLLSIEISPKKEDEVNLGNVVGEFYNELLNQLLRICVSNKTRTLRELITTRALYSSYIHENEIKNIPMDNEYDLDKIATNWYEGDEYGM
jgi:His-Xaa-Ser system protein HxsD